MPLIDSSQYKLIIVDDEESSIDILVDTLGNEYDLCVAMSGEAALRQISEELPDLILLDILMPGLDGYEVCEQLKADDKTASIPVIFVTAMGGITDEARGFKSGAVDYITKPFSPPIVKARIRTHLLIKEQHDQLKNSISLMQHEAEIINQKADLGIQAGCLAHDLNNLFTSASLIHAVPGQLPDHFENRDSVLNDLTAVSTSIQTGIEICRGYTNYLRSIGEDAIPQPLAPLLESLTMYSRRFRGTLRRDIADDIPPVLCKGYQLKRVFANLFINAIQALEGSADPMISLSLRHDQDRVVFTVRDNGPGIGPDILPRIFDERFSTKPNGTGLGLFLVKTIVDAHNGIIRVESAPGEGATFTVSFPASGH